MRSKLINTSFRHLVSNVERMQKVTVLTQGPDGYRCYQAAYQMPALSAENYEKEEEAAVEFARSFGSKLTRNEAQAYFHFTDDMRMAA